MIDYALIYTVSFIIVLSTIGIYKVGFKQFMRNFF